MNMEFDDDDDDLEDMEFDPLNDDEDDLGLEGDDEDEEPLNSRVALLAKNGMIALLELNVFTTGGVIVRIDPREGTPAAQRYDTPGAAKHFFRRSIGTSEKNGWTVAWEGAPNFG